MVNSWCATPPRKTTGITTNQSSRLVISNCKTTAARYGSGTSIFAKFPLRPRQSNVAAAERILFELNSCALLPRQRFRKKLVDQIVVERPQFFQVRFGVVLGVKIVRIEGAHPGEHLPILVIHQVIVLAITMRRIKRV